jgi:hypothetical protein
MFGIRTFLFGTCVGLGAGYFAMNYHVVHGPEGPVVVARTVRPPLRSIYVDVRNWSPAMWERYPDVTAALVQGGKGDLIAKGALNRALGTNSESAAPGWSTQDYAAGIKTKTEEGFTDFIDSLPPIKLESEEPTPTPSTIPSQTRRTDEGSMAPTTNAPIAATQSPARLGQSTDPAASPEHSFTTAKPPARVSPTEVTSTIPSQPANPSSGSPPETAAPARVQYENPRTLLGEPAPLPRSTPVTSTIPPTVEQRAVPNPETGSPIDALKSLFGGAPSGQISAAPRTDRTIRTPAF